MPNTKPLENTDYERDIMKDLEKKKNKRKMFVSMTFSGNHWKANWTNILNEQYELGYEWVPPFMQIGVDDSRVNLPPVIQAIFKDIHYSQEFQDYIGLVNNDLEKTIQIKRNDAKKIGKDGRARKKK